MAEASVGRGLRFLAIVIKPLTNLAEQAPGVLALGWSRNQTGG